MLFKSELPKRKLKAHLISVREKSCRERVSPMVSVVHVQLHRHQFRESCKSPEKENMEVLRLAKVV